MPRKTKEARQAYYREWRLRNPELNRAKNKRATTKYALRVKYGLTVQEYEALRSAQQNQCAICSVPFDGETVPHVDHSHSTGIVRGLLCRDCNLALGFFQDDPVKLQKALAYLARNSGA